MGGHVIDFDQMGGYKEEVVIWNLKTRSKDTLQAQASEISMAVGFMHLPTTQLTNMSMGLTI